MTRTAATHIPSCFDGFLAAIPNPEEVLLYETFFISPEERVSNAAQLDRMKANLRPLRWMLVYYSDTSLPVSVHVGLSYNDVEPGGLWCHRLLARLAEEDPYDPYLNTREIDGAWRVSPAAAKLNWSDWLIHRIADESTFHPVGHAPTSSARSPP